MSESKYEGMSQALVEFLPKETVESLRVVLDRDPAENRRAGCITLVAKVDCYVKRGETAYVSKCPSLGIVSQGRDVDEAKDALVDSIRMLLKFSFNSRTFSEVFAVFPKVGMDPWFKYIPIFRQVNQLYVEGEHKSAFDKLFAAMDEDLREKRFMDVNAVCNLAYVKSLEFPLMVGILVITRPFAEFLPCRDTLYEHAHEEARYNCEHGPNPPKLDALALLEGLEYKSPVEHWFAEVPFVLEDRGS